MIIPVILETEFEEVTRKVRLIEEYVKLIQIDIVDGILVNGKTFLDISQLDALNAKTTLELDLMVQNPLDYISLINNVKGVVIPVEAENVGTSINASKDLGSRTGVSIAPNTSLETLNLFAANVDFVQFMTIEPGGQGRPFQEMVLEKIKTFKENYPNMPVQVDGGITSETLKKVLGVGVNDIVVGSAIFDSEDPVKTLKEFQMQVEDYKL